MYVCFYNTLTAMPFISSVSDRDCDNSLSQIHHVLQCYRKGLRMTSWLLPNYKGKNPYGMHKVCAFVDLEGKTFLYENFLYEFPVNILAIYQICLHLQKGITHTQVSYSIVITGNISNLNSLRCVTIFQDWETPSDITFLTVYFVFVTKTWSVDAWVTA